MVYQVELLMVSCRATVKQMPVPAKASARSSMAWSSWLWGMPPVPLVVRSTWKAR
jgi:hypothetical protein